MKKVIYETNGKIALITLNRPESMNAIDVEMHRELWRTWTAFDKDDSLEVAIITGSGDKAFCAGADLKTHLPFWVSTQDAMLPRRKVKDGLGGITRGQHRIYKPIIAAVNGWTLAGGLELALACDIRIASEQAKFGSFEARRGFHHGDGGIVRLVNTCGVGVAMHMVLSAEAIDAQQALRFNLVTSVVPHESLLDAAQKFAGQILRNDTWAVRSAKETILGVIGRQLDDQLEYEALTAYSGVANPAIPGLLEQFYEKRDPGRIEE